MSKRILSGCLLVFAFLLIAEWVYPFHDILRIGGSSWTLLFIASCLLSSFFQLRFYISFPIHFVLVYLFSTLAVKGTSPLRISAISTFIDNVRDGIASMTELSAKAVPPLFIYLIFLVALWLLAYITFYSIFRKQRVLNILIMTLLYLLIINTFTQYDATFAIVRSCLFGFLILYLANWQANLSPSSHVFSKRIFYHLGIFALLFAILFAATQLPTYKPYFADPIPTLKSKFGLLDTTRQIGYSEDDSRLGGPLENDSTEVFQVQTESAHYYRVEAKWQYTGKGWETPKAEKTKPLSSQTDFPIDLNDRYDTKAKEQIDIEFTASNGYIAYPYGTDKLQSGASDIRYQPAGDKLTTENGIKKYHIELEPPVYDIPTMQKAKMDQLNKQFLAQYTQLPRELPKRVKRLAEKVTAGEKTAYDKAKAIETYLNSGGRFTYSIENADVTDRGKDYVDQFLFDTKIGYCDNFSTAMVVMLRSLGIPARWAKGFNSGTMIDDVEMTYQITNDNAHSWPEVYFPGTGWVPFEPTTTFSNPETFTEAQTEAPEQSADSTNDSEADTETPAEKPDTATPNQQKQEQQKQSKKETAKSKTTSSNDHSILLWISTITAIILLLLAIVAFLFRRQFTVWRLKRQLEKEAITFTAAYERLLHTLTTSQTKRQSSETLRQFAQRFSMIDGLAVLTQRYEQLTYGNSSENIISSEEKALFLGILAKLPYKV